MTKLLRWHIIRLKSFVGVEKRSFENLSTIAFKSYSTDSNKGGLYESLKKKLDLQFYEGLNKKVCLIAYMLAMGNRLVSCVGLKLILRKVMHCTTLENWNVAESTGV